MKNLFLTGLLSICTLGVFAQDNSAILPQNSKAFVSQNFPDATITSAKEESSWEIWDRDEKFEVHLSNGIKLDFNKDGEITEIDSKSGESIPQSVLPSNLVSYIKTNYPQAQIVSWEKNDQEQEVELDGGTELEFDAEGNFRKVD